MTEIPFDLLSQINDLISTDKSPADMLKSVYDSGGSSGSAAVDLTDGILGGSAAGNSKYYGTSPTGVLGFNALPSTTDNMLKSVYDTGGSSGSAAVDLADGILGGSAAGNSKYYGTSPTGVLGFNAFSSFFASNETKTVGPGKNYTTIQAAIDYFKGKIVYGTCTIEVDAGVYTENVVFSDIFVWPGSTLWLKGDTRLLAGLTYVDHAFGANSEARANGGSTDAACALTNALAVITVTVTGTNPDFDADGWVSGDKILIYNNAKAITEQTLTDASNATLTHGGGTIDVGNTGSAVCLCPNRVISIASGDGISVGIQGIKVTGFYVKSSVTTGTMISVLTPYASLEFGNVTCWKGSNGLDIFGIASHVIGCISIWNPLFIGIYSKSSNYATLYFATIIKAGNLGISNDGASLIYSNKSKAVGCITGYKVSLNCPLQLASCSTVINTTGFYAATGGFLAAIGCSARCSGNGANSATDGLSGSYVNLT